ncbi:asparagine synthase (glutamine-hydrolyzing) [soil metagenome]
MCGISGFCDFRRMLTKDHLQKGNDALQHRGPNRGDEIIYLNDKVHIGLAHRRLSILDISDQGNQPMFIDDKNVVIVIKGEIYNFKEIRKELETYGYHFHSSSDTEVVIKAYQKWGIEGVNKFIGMFAFCIYDVKKEKIFLLRDRAGIKPLHYFYKDNCLVFASELKAIYTYPNFVKDINHTAISLFFKYGYIPTPHTIFNNTYKVMPGHYVCIDIKTKALTHHKYYDVLDAYNKPKLKISENEALEHVEKLLISAFQYRMVSDVPVGVFLSGGYDSAAVCSILQSNNTQKIKTFTIGFHEDDYNEAHYAKDVAKYLGTDHNEYYCTIKEAQDIFPTLADVYDEPFGDSSSIPTILLSRFAKKQVTVALSADAGDEIFAGYDRYYQLNDFNKKLKLVPDFVRKAGAGLIKKLPLQFWPLLHGRSQKLHKFGQILSQQKETDLLANVSQAFSNKHLSLLLKQFDEQTGLYDEMGTINDENDYINSAIALDFKTYLVDDILVKFDRASMSVALEGREPFLDYRIIDFVSQLPSDLKHYKCINKYLLKKITHKYIPQKMLDRPKSGFGLPVYKWFRSDLKDYLFYYINEQQLAKHDLFDNKKVIALRDDFLSGKNKNEVQIWLLLMFQTWWNKWMENDSAA